MNLAEAEISATMTLWTRVTFRGEECLFGFAERHAVLGGLSYVMSTPILEFTASFDRARTANGRVYALGKRLDSVTELDEEGELALRLLLASADPDRPDPEYPGKYDDIRWLIALKIARHLRLDPPARQEPESVTWFIEEYREAYMQLRASF